VGDILLFQSKAELSAEYNVAGFEQFCRTNLILFGADLPFDNDSWDITSEYPVKGSKKKSRAIFSSYEAARIRRDMPTISPGYKGFAKSYFRYSLTLRSSTQWSNRLAALRVLDHALCAEGLDGQVYKATHDIFSKACLVISKAYQAETAAKIAGQLAEISKFLVENDLCQMKTAWVNPLKKPNDLGIRIGAEADKAREKKLPSKEAIEALAYIFQTPESAAEVFVTSTLALMYCFPQRINEVVRLPYNCEVEEDDEQKPHYGLREPGSKGFDDSVRWIVPTMEPVARAAIKNLKDASSEARKVALWYEKNPAKVYLLPEFEYLREKTYVTQDEVGAILYGKLKPMKSWCNAEKVGIVIPKHYSFVDVERVVLGKLPKDIFQTSPALKYSESLFIVRRFELDATLNAYACIVDRISHGEITARLGSSGSATSIFEKRGFKEVDGTVIDMRSHQARHYLNTLAQANGASQLDIAMWSGRADPSQNSVYDHVTPGEILTKTKAIAVAAGSQLFSGVTEIPKVRVVAHRDDATGKLITGTAHATLYGMCRHDYASSPCQIHRDCLNCHEHVCVKGNTVKLENIRRLRNETEVLLTKAEVAEQQSKHGASRWVVHQRKTLIHCEQLLSILENPAISDGALVALTEIRSASRFEQVGFLRQEKLEQPKRNKLLEKMKNAKN
jgi:hypothetical protein